MEARALAEGINALALTIDADRQQRLLRYLQLMEKWNRVYNLTAIRERLQMVYQHLLDSLAIVPHVRPNNVLDVGSGAGLPGIPLAIARPELQVTLLDSNRKKCAFLRQAMMELDLSNVSVDCARIETYRSERLFDTVVSRAFAETSVIAKLCVPQLAPGGAVLAMKGSAPEEEAKNVVGLAAVKAILRLQVPGLGAERHLVVMTRA